MFWLDAHSRALRSAIPFQSHRRMPGGPHFNPLYPRRQFNRPTRWLEIFAAPATALCLFATRGSSIVRTVLHGPAKLGLASRPRHRGKRIHCHKRLRLILRGAPSRRRTLQRDVIIHAHPVLPFQPNRFFIRLRQRVEISPPQKGKKHKWGDRTTRRLSPTRVRVTSPRKNYRLEVSPKPIRRN